VIRIHKPDVAPRVLREDGARLTEALCRRVEVGQPPEFDGKIYGSAEVKHALSAAQHDKCCFCESKLGQAQFGDIEHFRPKGRTRQRPDEDPTTGYYWLVYAWDNLYLSCAICNQRHKRDLFPLANPEHRVSTHHRAAELEAEQPLFVDPGHEDPAQFIGFHREYAAPVAGSVRGRETRDALGLNRDHLKERRRQRYLDLRAWLLTINVAVCCEPSAEVRAMATTVLERIRSAAIETAEYSSMTRSLLRAIAPWRDTWAAPASALFEELRSEAARGLRLRIA
jgi:uncharacterized protein (TIGR02646 family)